MGENDGTQQGDPQTTGQTSQGAEGSTSKQIPETYTKDQMEKFRSDALAEQGRKHKAELDPIVKERDSLKSQIQSKEDEIKDITEEREKLQTQIDDLTSDDPEKFDLVKKDKELREQERKLKSGLQELEADKQAHAETVKLASDTLREISIWEIAAEYESGDPVKLKDLCDTFTATSEEQIRKVADNLWTKKPTEPKKPPPPPIKPDSGATSGEGIDTSKMSADEKLKEGFRQLKKK